jgi:mycofactocin precursor
MSPTATEVLDRPETEITEDAQVSEEQDEVIAADLLVEEISIDGMCGVY